MIQLVTFARIQPNYFKLVVHKWSQCYHNFTIVILLLIFIFLVFFCLMKCYSKLGLLTKGERAKGTT